MLTDPAFTRFRASQPCVELAEMVNNSEVVFVQVSGGRELLLKPGLNIDGGVQPRGLSDVLGSDMPDMPDMPDMLDMPDILDILDIPDILDMPDIGAIDRETADVIREDATAAEVLDVSAKVVVGIDMSIAMLESPAAIRFDIPDIVIEPMFIEVPPTVVDDESSPSIGPALRMWSGRHWTLPRPLASRLSTQFGNAPVSKYCA